MNGRIFLCMIWGCILPGILSGQSTGFFGSSRSASLAGGGLTFEDVNSLFTNPAGVARLDRAALIAAAEQPFLLKELQAISLALALPSKAGSFAFSLQRKGFSLFNRQHIGLGYARSLSENFSISLRLWLFRTSIRDHGNFLTTGFELGFQHQITQGLTFGGRLLQTVAASQGSGTAPPSLLAIGLGYRPSEKTMLLLEVEKASTSPARLSMGVEYQPSAQLALRIGAGAPPAGISFGVGIHLNRILSIDAGARYHPFLGFSPGITFLFPGRK